jgi:hypothetical protein
VIVITPGIVSVTVMKPSPGMSGAMAEGKELELEVAEDTISDGGTIGQVSVAVLEGRGLELEVAGETISDGGTIDDGETISDVVFWVGHDEDPPSRRTGQ